MVNALRTSLKWAATACAAGLIAGACTVKDQTAPPLAGPSESALSVVVTATPDSILQDGASQAAIAVLVRDANARPVSGQVLRLDMAVNGSVQDFGTLAARSLVTGSDGRASTTYTSPMASPAASATGGSGTRVQVVVTPTGSNFATAQSQSVDIRLVPVGVILPAAGSPKAAFTFTPNAVIANSPVQFDASASCGSTDASNNCTTVSRIVTYSWSFSDGGQATGSVVSHTFTAVQQSTVTLTVTNDRGLAASATQSIAVGAGNVPTSAQFRFSPDSPIVGQTIVFDASEAKAGLGHTLTQYKWNFGDLATAGGMVVSHAYTATGKYAVTLTVVDDAGQSLANSQQVTIGTLGEVPFASFTMSPDNPLTLRTWTQFDASKSAAPAGATIVSYAWVFADGSNGVVTSTPFTTHTWMTEGLFTMSLTVTDSNGKTAVATKQVSVR